MLAARDALAVVRARGVNVDDMPDAQLFFGPSASVAEGIRAEYQTNPAARKIMQRHNGGDELTRIYRDVLDTGLQLNVAMPHLAALRDAVDAWRAKASTRP